MIISGAKLVNTGYVVDVQPIIATNLVANYDPATGISGSTFTDSSGNGYNATLYNSPTTTTIYYLAVTNSNSCTSYDTVIVTVNTLPNLYAVTGGGTFCSGASGVSIGLTGSQTGITYQLFNGM